MQLGAETFKLQLIRNLPRSLQSGLIRLEETLEGDAKVAEVNLRANLCNGALSRVDDLGSDGSILGRLQVQLQSPSGDSRLGGEHLLQQIIGGLVKVLKLAWILSCKEERKSQMQRRKKERKKKEKEKKREEKETQKVRNDGISPFTRGEKESEKKRGREKIVKKKERDAIDALLPPPCEGVMGYGFDEGRGWWGFGEKRGESVFFL